MRFGVLCAQSLLVFLLSAPSFAQTEEADAHYRRGVEHARNGQWTLARSEFEAAFSLSPHPSVLYSLAKVALEMGDEGGAALYLERYLALAKDDVSQAERAEVQSTLDALRGPSGQTGETASAEPSHERAGEDAPEGATGPAPAPQRAARAPTPRAHPHEPERTPAEPAASTTRQIPERDSDLGLGILTGAGFGFLGAGVGLWVYNAFEHSAASRERQTLLEYEQPDQFGPEDVDPALEQAARVGRNQSDFETIERLDVVAWSMIGVGVACAGIGTWLLFTSDDPEREAVSFSVEGVEIRW